MCVSARTPFANESEQEKNTTRTFCFKNVRTLLLCYNMAVGNVILRRYYYYYYYNVVAGHCFRLALTERIKATKKLPIRTRVCCAISTDVTVPSVLTTRRRS